LNSDSILKSESDLELKLLVETCQVRHGEFTQSVVYLWILQLVDDTFLTVPLSYMLW